MGTRGNLDSRMISYHSARRILFLLYGVLFLFLGSFVSVGFLEAHASPDGIIEPVNRILITHVRIAALAMGLLCIAAAIPRELEGRRFQRCDEYAVKIGVLVASLLICLLALEAGARLYLYAKEVTLAKALPYSHPGTHNPHAALRLIDAIRMSDNRALIYELIPGTTGVLFGAPVAINQEGYRGRLYPHERTAGTFRVVGIGDSIAFGVGVDVEDAYLSLVERLLTRKGTSCEVINLAAPGYNTAMEVELLAWKGLSYNPDLIILSFCTNDYALPHYLRGEHNLLTLKRSVLYDLLIRSAPLLRGLEPSPWGDACDPATLESTPPEYRHMVGREGVINAFKRLRSATFPGNIPVVVEYYDCAYKGIPGTEAYRANETQLFLERVCLESGFYYCDCTNILYDYAATQQRPFREIFWLNSHDPHPSRTAHRLIAECLKEFILAHNLIRPIP